MGTRADFYIRTATGLDWLGSVAMDGYDIEEMTAEFATKSARNQSCLDVKQARTEQEFRAALQSYFSHRWDVTMPAHGWPWPWENSETTDRAYVFDGGVVKLYACGKEIVAGDDDAEGPAPDCGWPNMTDRQNVTLGPRSGVIFIGS